ncbi:MAG: NTP transferase domain-containing protein [Lentisphaeria bacterium]|nr:NTP transferase domain-containing protein [Lentisphaeria bacterium]
MNRRIIIPAAGKGSRLNSSEDAPPKVMHCVNGRPLLQVVLSQTDFIEPENTYIVVGYKKEAILDFFGDKYHYVEQKEQKGTGHAVLVCENHFKDFDGTILVTFGDMPLFRRENMLALCQYHEDRHAACTLLTAQNPELKMWARIVRNEQNAFRAIVEGKDCTPEQAMISELFAGVLVFDSKLLFRFLPLVGSQNVQHEYYLTEVPELMVKAGLKVETFPTDNGDDLRGVNTQEDLLLCEQILKRRMGL